MIVAAEGAFDGNRFSLDSAGVSRRERVPIGVFPSELMAAVIAAMPPELPAMQHVWFVDASGITTPVRIEFGRRGQIDMPVPKAGEECHKGTKTRKVQVEAIEVTYTLGADRVSRIVLADAPHVLAMADGLQCVRLPGQPF